MYSSQLPNGAVEWLAQGSRGLSSETMFTHLTGFDCTRRNGVNHPHDPADLDRCLRMLDAIPSLKTEVYRMATASPYWAALVEHWDAITKSHIEEVGIGWTKAKCAPLTYRLMRDVLEAAYKKEQP